MSLHIECCRCSEELDMPGAIALTPPSDEGIVFKLHFCVTCWHELMQWCEAIPPGTPLTAAGLIVDARAMLSGGVS